jgi:hypothetical protein
VREQTLLQRYLAGFPEVLVNGVVAPLAELVVDRGVAVVGFVPEREQRLRAARLGARPARFSNLVGTHQLGLPGDVVVRAVGAGVPAGRRQRDEDVPREREFVGGLDVFGPHGERVLDGRFGNVEVDAVLVGARNLGHVSASASSTIVFGPSVR